MTQETDDLDELALRRLLQSAVGGIEPSTASLDRLRVAVPARRARKRQALVGVAAAALLLGTAIPAAVHVVSAPAGEDDTAIAGSSQDARDHPAGSGSPRDGHRAGPGPRHSGDSGEDGTDESGEGKHGGKGAPSGIPEPTSSAALAAAPACAATQLGDTVANSGSPGPDGTVYGSFRVANVSGKGCTVDSPGQLNATAHGAAARTVIQVVEHTAGDPAGRLPAPSAAVPAMVLAPGASYEVRFAYVPKAECPSDPGTVPGEGENSGGTGGGEGDSGGGGGTAPSQPAEPTPSTSAGTPGEGPDSGPSPVVDSGTGGGSPQGGQKSGPATADTAVTTQLLTTALVQDKGEPGGVSLTHTTLPGGPSAGTTLPEACGGGTVYRTGILQTPGTTG
ncbi:hypothetical protein AB0J21_11020 [Streptomyces sp. NPDC049954]|uniref:hypothetical protein n=1 Tax=Streptomyces sp. NPDC049954 TaxID=3155779 RepID=UPI00342C3A65